MIKMHSYRQILCASVAALSLVAASAAQAAPEGGAVSRGSASISQNGKKTDIHQSSSKVILDWRSFDIGADEHTEFHQPSRSAIALNRINDTKASQINGKLTANGNIMLINPNGVVFGKGAQVDVGSLTATTANIDNDDFMAGKMDFKHAGNADAYIVNQGKISVKEAGLVNFVAPKVVNDGVIVAKLGKVQLAATDTFTLDMAGDGLIQVAVDETETQKIASNKGAILAEGGYVAVTAGKARNLVDSLVENTGVIAAASMTKKGGKVILGGADTGITVNDGAIDVSGRKNSVQGGEATVLGRHIVLSANSFIDASGTTEAPVSASRTDTATMTADKKVKTEEEFLADENRGGGSIKIGGDYLGTGDTARAQTVFVDAQALTLNDATQYGDGGRTIFWSDDTTSFSGLVYARGGLDGGHGGFLETSGKMDLLADGFADLSAGTDSFRKGTYLLDPNNIAIYGTVDPRFVSTDGSVNLDTHLQLWLDASDASTITKDGSGRVTAWRDKSHNGYIATAPTVAAQPLSTTSASMNNLGVMYFNGGEDHLTLGSNYIFSTNSGLVVGGVMQSTFETGQSQFVMNFGNNGAQHYGLTYSTTAANLRGPTAYGGAGVTSATHGKTTSQASIVLGEFVFGSSQNVYIDGSQTATGTSSTPTLTALGPVQIDENPTTSMSGGPVTIGTQSKSLNQGIRGLDGYLGELYIYNDTLTADEKAILNQYEAVKWNLALNPKAATSDSEAVEAMASDGYSVFAARYLERLSQTADIVLQATNNITIDLMGDTLSLDNNRSISLTTTSGDILTASAGAIETHGTGNISFTAGQDILLHHDLDLTAQGTGNITLRANRNIDSNAGGDFATHGGNIIFNADRNGDSSGAVRILDSTIATGGGAFVVGGGSNPYTNSTKASQNGVYDIGADIRNSSVVTGNGNISIRGAGENTGDNNYGVYIYNSSLTTGTTPGSGIIDIYGNGGYAEDHNYGVYIAQNSLIRSDYGAVTIDGRGRSNGNSTSDDNYGFWMRSGSQILSQGTGNNAAAISIVGVGGSGNLNNAGFLISDNNTLLSSIDGDMLLRGTGARNVAYGGVTGAGAYGFVMNSDSDITATGTVAGQGANIEIVSVGDVAQFTGDTVTAQAGNITLNVSHWNMALDALTSANGDVIIRPNTVSTSIAIGGGVGTLSITDAQLAVINAGRKLIIGDSIAGEGDVIVDSWNLSGKSYDVEIYGNDITFQDTDNTSGVDYAVNMGSGSFLAHAMDKTGDTGVITANAMIRRNALGTSRLDLRADQNIIFNTGSGVSSLTGMVNTILNADRDGDHDGAISLDNANFATNGGYFVAGGGAGTIDSDNNGILGDGGNGADNVKAWGNLGRAAGVSIANTSSITTGIGSIIINGRGYDNSGTTAHHGVNISSGSLNTTSGNITVNATGGASNTNGYGLHVNGGTISTQTGLINLTGTSGSVTTGVNDSGMVIFGSSVIEATGSGSITLTGTGATSSDLNIGTGGVNRIGSSTMTGDIELNVNRVIINDTDNAILTQGSITVKPTTASTSIGLGGGAGILDLNDAELAQISAGRKLIIGDATHGTGDIDLDSWNWSSKSFTNVELYGNSIDIGGMTMGAGSFMAYAKDNGIDYGDLNISGNITRGANNSATLDLRADRNITNSNGADIIASDANSDGDNNAATSADSLNVILNADHNANNDGAVSLAYSTVTTLGGYFIAGGGAGTVDSDNNGILGDGGTGADYVAAWGNAVYKDGVFIDHSTISTGAGSIYITGHGWDNAPSYNNSGIYILTSSMTTVDGSLYLHGTGGIGAGSNRGVHYAYGSLMGSSGTGDIIIVGYGGESGASGFYSNGVSGEGGEITAQGGLIDIRGYAATVNGGFSTGFDLSFSSTITNNNGGAINIYGEAHGPSGSNNGIAIFSDNNSITANGGGDITLEAMTTSPGSAIDLRSVNSLRTTGAGNISLLTDSLYLDTAGAVNSANDVLLNPRTAGASITLGSTSGSMVNFSDVSLSRITANRLIVGNSAGGNGNITIDSLDLSSRSYDLEIYGNGITLQDTDNTGGVDYALNMGAGDVLIHAMGSGGDMAVNAAIHRGVAGASALNLRADESINFGSAGNIIATTGEIDLRVDSDYDSSGGETIVFDASSIDTNGGDIDIDDAAAIGANATWNARGGTITTGGAIALGSNDLTMIADNLTLGDAITGDANSVLTLKPYQNNRSIGLGGGAGGFNLTDAELAGLDAGRLIIGDAALGTGDVTINSWNLSGKTYDTELYGNNFTIAGMTLGGGDTTIDAGNNVSVTSAIGNSGAGGDIYINVGNDFTNSAGANGINAGTGGRFLIYADAVSNVTRGGIARGNLFNRTFAGDDPSTIDASFGSRFVFNQQPTLTVRANNVTLGYYDPAYNSFSYSVSGLVTGDTAASALSGVPAYMTSQLNATDYTITPSMGTLASTLGYLIAFQNGLLVMADSGGPTTPPSPPAPNPPLPPGIPPSVEQQIQSPSLAAGGGYGYFPPIMGAGIHGAGMAQISYDMTARKNALIRVNTNDSDAFSRMASGGYVIVDNPLAVYYGLCSYNASYCN